jgi:hypothetical protein
MVGQNYFAGIVLSKAWSYVVYICMVLANPDSKVDQGTRRKNLHNKPTHLNLHNKVAQ